MKVVSGAASLVRRSAAVSGNQHGVGTAQIVTAQLGDQPVQIAMPSPPQIEEGDEVVVAGDIEGGTLHARAYMNRSNGTYGSWRTAGCAAVLGLFFSATLFGALGILVAMSLVGNTNAWLGGLIGTLFLLGVWGAVIVMAIMPDQKTRKALDLVRSR